MKNRKYFKDRRGVTLVELIVTFALIGLFMTAASSMLTSTLNLFTRMQATSRAITVSDMLLDKISGEITAAIVPPAESTNGYYFWIQPQSVAENGESQWVVFRNRSKSPVAIFAAEAKADGKADTDTMGQGELFIRYYSVSKAESRAVQELDWHFDSRAYMGYTIKKLWFEREHSQTHPNVVKIHLTLHNNRTGFEYSTFRYAENYNYDGMYMSERDDGQTNFPLDKGDGKTGAVEFEIKKSGGGGGEEPEEPEKPELDGFVVYYISTYSGKEIREKSVISANYGDELILRPVEVDGYNLANGSSWEVSTIFTEENREYVFQYDPFVNEYAIVFESEAGPELAKVTGVVRTDETISGELPLDKLYGYRVYDGNYDDVIVKDGKWEFTALGYQDSTRYHVRIKCYLEDVPYTIYYKCGNIVLDKDPTGVGKYGTTVGINNSKNIEGYEIVDWYKSLVLDNLNGCEVTFQYRLKLNDSAPFHPIGSNIEIEIEAKTQREPTDMENQIAQDIFRFFNEDWSTIEVSGAKYLTGAYRIFELNGEIYAVAGGTNREKFENSLQAELMKKEGIRKGNIIEIKEDDISSEEKRKVFLEYILKNAGASEEYIQEIHGIEIEFDKDDNPKRLEEVSFKNKQGEEIKIKYK